MNDLLEVDDILVVTKLLKHCNLADSCTGDTVVAVVDLDLLHSHSLVSLFLRGLVDYTIGALTESPAVGIFFLKLFRSLDGTVLTTTRPPGSLPVLLVLLLLLVGDFLRTVGRRKRRLRGLHGKLSLDHGDVLFIVVHSSIVRQQINTWTQQILNLK